MDIKNFTFPDYRYSVKHPRATDIPLHRMAAEYHGRDRARLRQRWTVLGKKMEASRKCIKLSCLLPIITIITSSTCRSILYMYGVSQNPLPTFHKAFTSALPSDSIARRIRDSSVSQPKLLFINTDMRQDIPSRKCTEPWKHVHLIISVYPYNS